MEQKEDKVILEGTARLEEIEAVIQKIRKPLRRAPERKYHVYTHIVLYTDKDSGLKGFSYLFEENIPDVTEYVAENPHIGIFAINQLGREIARRY